MNSDIILRRFYDNFTAKKQAVEGRYQNWTFTEYFDKKFLETIREVKAEERKENIDTAFKVANATVDIKLENLVKELNELKIINPEKEPPKNKLTQNQVFQAGQMNVLIRIKVILDKYK